MAQARVLVVEDDQDINEIVTAKLTKAGYACDHAFSGTEASLLLERAASAPYDVVVTDLMLPGLTGERIVELVRASGADTPVIVISARVGVSDRVDLLRLGADDYLVKPFDLDELVARVEVQLRHHARDAGASPAGASGDVRTFGRWRVDGEARTMTVDGKPVDLTRTEFDIVRALVGRPKKVFTKAELFELVWDEPCPPGDNSVTVHVSNIRAKRRPTGTDGYVKTVWGLGFKLDEAAR